MKITHLGASTIIIEHNGKRILFDPWLDDGIVYGAWYRWPSSNIKVEEIGKLDYIIISHIHEDHCSPGTIKKLNKDSEVIIMDRAPNFVKKFLEYHNFDFKKIHLIKPYTKATVCDDIEISFVEAHEENHFAYLIDSGIIIKCGDRVLYNSNDCLPNDKGLKFIKANYKKIDLALLPYTGVSGYPNCYSNLSHDEKLQEAKRIQLDRYKVLKETSESLNPKWTMPFADQFVIAGKNSYFNRYSPHPPSLKNVHDYFENNKKINLLLLNIGQTFDLNTEKKIPEDNFIAHTEKDRENYIKRISHVKYDHELLNLNESISEERLLDYASKRLFFEQEKQKYFSDWKILFEIKQKKMNKYYLLNLNEKKILKLDNKKNLSEPYLIMSLERNVFILLLLGHMSWNMADGAFFIQYERAPNIYDPKFYAFINYLKV